MEEEIKLVAKLADYEAEINELEILILDNINSDKVPLYKKDLVVLKTKYTKTKNQLNNLINKEKANAK